VLPEVWPVLEADGPVLPSLEVKELPVTPEAIEDAASPMVDPALKPLPVDAEPDLPPTDPTTPVALPTEPAAVAPELSEPVLDPGAEKQAVAVRGMDRTTFRSRLRKLFIEGLHLKR
jgi:hypothetical protein